MACNGYQRILLDFDGKILIGQQSVSLSFEQTMIDVSSKDNADFKAYCAGLINATGSVTKLTEAYSATPDANSFGLNDAIVIQKSKEPVSFLITEYDNTGVPIVGAANVSGVAFISNASIDSPTDAASTFSMDIQITGDVTTDVNS